MKSIALLMFNRNETAGVMRVLQRTSSLVDEVVIIDNSEPSKHNELEQTAGPLNPRIFWAAPLGYPEPLGAYALQKVRSEFVLRIDTDEVPSEALLDDLKRLQGSDAYLVPIREARDSVSYHRIRLFRKGSVEFNGLVHDELRVNGRIGVVETTHCIEHLRRVPKVDRYFAVEAFEHPLTMISFTSYRVPPAIRGLMSTARRSMGLRNLMAWIAILGGVGASLVPPRSELVSDMRYRIEYHRYFGRLSRAEKGLCEAIAKGIHESGGIIRYLGLDDLGYVERLSEALISRSMLDGIKNLYQLSVYRHAFGEKLDPDVAHELGKSVTRVPGYLRGI